MTNPQNDIKPEAPEGAATQAAAPASETVAALTEADLSGLVGGLPSAEEMLAAATAERDGYRDRLLRTAAELENLRKRTEREKADIKKYAVADFARDVLGLGDSIKRAIEHVPPDAADKDPALKSFLEGVQLLERDLLASLERHGVLRFSPMGERVDPNRHQAVVQVPDATVATGTIVQVFQDGYMIGDRVLRAAMVAVSAGGPKVVKAAEVAAAPVAATSEDGATAAEGVDRPEESGQS